MRAMRIVKNPQDRNPRSNLLAMVRRKNRLPVFFMDYTPCRPGVDSKKRAAQEGKNDFGRPMSQLQRNPLAVRKEKKARKLEAVFRGQQMKPKVREAHQSDLRWEDCGECGFNCKWWGWSFDSSRGVVVTHPISNPRAISLSAIFLA